MTRFTRRHIGILAGMITAVALTAGALIALSADAQVVVTAITQAEGD